MLGKNSFTCISVTLFQRFSIDTLGWTVLCCGRGCPVHCKMFSNISGFYLIDGHSTFHPLWFDNHKCLQTLSNVPLRAMALFQATFIFHLDDPSGLTAGFLASPLRLIQSIVYPAARVIFMYSPDYFTLVATLVMCCLNSPLRECANGSIAGGWCRTSSCPPLGSVWCYAFLSFVLRLPFLNHARLPLVLILFIINFLLLEFYCSGYLYGELT